MTKEDINRVDDLFETNSKKAVKQISEKLQQGEDAEAVRLFIEYRSKGQLPKTMNIVQWLNSEIGEEAADRLVAAMLRQASDLDIELVEK